MTDIKLLRRNGTDSDSDAVELESVGARVGFLALIIGARFGLYEGWVHYGSASVMAGRVILARCTTRGLSNISDPTSVYPYGVIERNLSWTPVSTDRLAKESRHAFIMVWNAKRTLFKQGIKWC